MGITAASELDRTRQELLADIERWLPEVEAVSIVGTGKPLNRLTMGERLDVLRTLDRKRAIVPQTGLISKPGGQVLERLTALRNNFAHGTIPSVEGPTQTQQFLKLARQLCKSELVEILARNNE